MFGWQAAYRRARNFERQDNWAEAVQIYRWLVGHGEEGNARVQFRLGYGLFRLEQLDDALSHLERANAMQPGEAEWLYRLAFVHERKKNYSEAARWYEAALAVQETEKWRNRLDKCKAALAEMETAEQRSTHRSALQDVLATKAAAWEKLDVLEAGAVSHGTDRKWLAQLAQARFDMGRYEEAANAYSQVLTLGSKDPNIYFMVGWAWRNCGRAVLAERYFDSAVKFDKRLDAKSLGIGVFFQEKGQWKHAADSYIEALEQNPENAELCFRAGLALQKVYSWVESEKYLARAILLGPAAPVWHYRRGLAWERQKKFQKAAESYLRATEESPTVNRYWYYRLGYTLTLAGDFRRACEAYEKSLQMAVPPTVGRAAENTIESYQHGLADLQKALTDALQSQSASLCVRVGEAAESFGALETARVAYEAGVARTEAYDPTVFYRLGRVMAAQGDWELAARAYANVRVFKRPYGVDVTPYVSSPAARKSMTYLEYSETAPIFDDTILYESGHGVSASCNPLAMFREITNDPRFAGYTHVWVINDKKRVPAELKHRADVIFAERESDLYLRYLASAKYLINNNTFPPYFVRREGQKYLNTWHGTPLKTLGRDIKSGIMDHRNAARNFLHATHMIFPNTFTADCLIEKYDIGALYSGELALTGYPRNDATISMDAESRTALRRRLGIPRDKSVVLYAPTWRGTLAKKQMDTARLAGDLAVLGSGQWHFLYRGHSVSEGLSGTSVSDRYSVPPDIDTNDLLAIVDVLVTDYSSIMFDFMGTGRPIIYYAYDLEEYQEERGLYFSLEDMGGVVTRTAEETAEELTHLTTQSTTPAFDMDALTYAFHEHETGEASKRAVDFFFFGSDEFVIRRAADERPNVLFYAGSFIPNGVTSAYLNLVNNLDAERYNLHVVLEPGNVITDEGRKAKFDALPEHVHALGRVGTHLVTPEERWIIDKFNTQHRLDNDEMWGLYNYAHRREFVRLFGASVFDAIVCFEGYARFWASVLGNPATNPSSSSIYLHSVMVEEWKNRFPYLEGLFKLYGRYDQLLSVSQSASEVNKRDLSEPFGIDAEKFDSVTNLLNIEEALDGARLELDSDVEEWMSNDHVHFVSVGRLSPEKGHLKLIKAFSKVVSTNPQARLMIVGSGPMADRISALISELSLEDHVMLAGMRTNPYAIVNRSDCFVFSSDYEGQGIAVLEALVLGKPVISTNVTGPKSILERGYGHLVDNSIGGLFEGMHRFMAGELSFAKFDYDEYQKKSIDSFVSKAIGIFDKDSSSLTSA